MTQAHFWARDKRKERRDNGGAERVTIIIITITVVIFVFEQTVGL